MPCLQPIKLKTGDVVPCSKCPECIQRRINGWTFRLMQEEKICLSAQFITLTYDSHNLPFDRAGKPSLSKRDVQLFFKRLRKAHGKVSNKHAIRYYAVGEYGGKRWRPHYHIILFNAKLELIQDAWRNPKTKKHIGHVHYGTVSGASIGYTLKYLTKQDRVKKRYYETRQPEFSLMSKGLGSSYISDQTIAYHKRSLTDHSHLTFPGGVKIAMPRYYKDKIYSTERKAEMALYWKGKYESDTLEEFYSLGPAEFHKKHRDLKQSVEAAYQKMYLSNQKRHK